jgi:hypothetical protein
MLIFRPEGSFLFQRRYQINDSNLSAKKQACCELLFRRRGNQIWLVFTETVTAAIQLIVPAQPPDLTDTEAARTQPKAADA